MTFPFQPQLPCADCFNDPARHAHGADGSMIVIHCQHHNAGGVYRPQMQKWTVISPVTQDEFATYCSRLGVIQMAQVAQEDGLPTAAKPN